MIDYRIYYAAFHSLFRFSQAKMRKLYLEWGSDIGQLWENFDPVSVLPILQGVSREECSSRHSSFDLPALQRRIEELGVTIVFEDDDVFPAVLQEVHPSVCMLYCIGDTSLLLSPSIAVVGARKMSIYAKQVLEDWIPVVEKAGSAVLSGGAVGVDARAHARAVELGIPTIAVLGSGVDVMYPACNKQLFHTIVAQSGLLVSEFPVGAKPEVFHFPLRNRILAALAHTILVVEAKQKSGALITAKIALELGKEVLAVVGNMYDEGREGVHRIIQKGEAAPVVSKEHFAELLGISSQHLEIQEVIPECTEKEATLLQCCTHIPQEQDLLLVQSGLSIQDFQLCLTTLELKSYIQKVQGTKWIRLCSYKTVTRPV